MTSERNGLAPVVMLLVASLCSCADQTADGAVGIIPNRHQPISQVRAIGYGEVDPSDSSMALTSALLQANGWALLSVGARHTSAPGCDGGTLQILGKVTRRTVTHEVDIPGGIVVAIEADVHTEQFSLGRTIKSLRRSCPVSQLGESVQHGLLTLLEAPPSGKSCIVRMEKLSWTNLEGSSAPTCTYVLTLNEAP